MLAVAITGGLAILDSATVKKAPETFAPTINDLEPSTSSAWASDNKSLYLLSAQNIRRYEPASGAMEDVYVVEGFGSLSHVVVKDQNTIVFTANDKVHVMDCAATPAKLAHTFVAHKSAVTSLALSNDASLLASTSAAAVHVHNLAQGTQTALRGLPLAGQTIATSAFHRHSRSRLLLGIGKQLVVCDTSRPAAPLKTVVVGSASSGDVIAIACSPFSKTLIAVATAGGHIGLIDLDKEKSLFRTLNVKVPLTALSFSPEGASIYAGTETGKVLIVDLRSLDKPPRSIAISASGSRVESMSVQPKVKTEVKPTINIAESNSPRKAAKASRSPVSRRASELATPRKPSLGLGQQVSSPARDPLGNSSSNDEIPAKQECLNAAHSTAKKATSSMVKRNRLESTTKPSAPLSRVSVRENASVTNMADTKKSPAPGPPHTRTRTMSTLGKTCVSNPTSPTSPSGSSSATASTATRSRRTISTDTQITSVSSKTSDAARRTRTVSTSSPVSKADWISARSSTQPLPRTRALSSASRIESSHRETSPPPPMPPLPPTLSDEPAPFPRNSTPSPDLPDIDNPVTPLPSRKKGKSILGLGTPELHKWIQSDQKGKRSVGFKEDGLKEANLEVQVSPRRSTPMRPSGSWVPSPLRNPTSPGTVVSAQDFLKGIVGDVMFEYHKETKAQMTGLHLELMSMRRGLRKEMDEVMEQYVGDLKDLREENKRLRDENERLRRGY